MSWMCVSLVGAWARTAHTFATRAWVPWLTVRHPAPTRGFRGGRAP